MSPVETFMTEDLRAAPLPDGVEALAAAILQRFNGAGRALVLYGSCRRRASSEGLVDLLLIVSGYRAAHGSRISACLNACLPPNVYYLEAGGPSGRVRCKFAVVSEAAFARRCRGGLDAWFWARFSQPARLVWAVDEHAASAVASSRADAALRFAGEAAPLLPGVFDGPGLWREALAASYRCELRAESAAAARALIDADRGYWDALSALVLPRLQMLRVTSPAAYVFSGGAMRRVVGRFRWQCRRAWGKLLSVLRLLKAAGTFSNGVDYLLWKVERHSGVRVEVTERMRRHPRIAAWGLAWRLWRRGGFR